MRLRPVFLALAASALAWSAAAQTEGDAAHDHFQSELARQCPQKRLDLLPERALRDGLDDYMGGLGPDERGRLQQSERDHCSAADSAGAACVNLADLAAADQGGRIEEVATSICSSFLRCRDQGACDYAR